MPPVMIEQSTGCQIDSLQCLQWWSNSQQTVKLTAFNASSDDQTVNRVSNWQPSVSPVMIKQSIGCQIDSLRCLQWWSNSQQAVKLTAFNASSDNQTANVMTFKFQLTAFSVYGDGQTVNVPTWPFLCSTLTSHGCHDISNHKGHKYKKHLHFMMSSSSLYNFIYHIKHPQQMHK